MHEFEDLPDPAMVRRSIDEKSAAARQRLEAFVSTCEPLFLAISRKFQALTPRVFIISRTVTSDNHWLWGIRHRETVVTKQGWHLGSLEGPVILLPDGSVYPSAAYGVRAIFENEYVVGTENWWQRVVATEDPTVFAEARQVLVDRLKQIYVDACSRQE
jgi:hypothetical protein